MARAEIKKALLAIIGLALLSISVWLFEIVKKIGWAGVMWLDKDLFSPILIGIFAALAYITPFWIGYRRIDGRIILTALTFCMINLTTYFLANMVLRGMYYQSSYGLWFLTLIVLALFIGGYYYVTDQLIMPLEKQKLILYAACIAVMFVLSITTVFFIRGFGTNYGFMDAVKMGYPQFWICILLGLSGIYLVQNHQE
jgi:hypothetical protein